MADLNKFYPAKLLLIGEYSVLHDHPGLAIPLNNFSGHFELGSKNSKSHLVIKELFNYIVSKGIPHLNRTKLEEDINQGLYFESNIPQGYGIGSSGALVAGIYDQYFDQKTDNLNELKNILGSIESYFHGNSSGLDPLVSYTRSGVLLTASGKAIGIDFPHLKDYFFLIDTGEERKTGKLVKQYLVRYESDMKFQSKMIDLATYNRKAIVSLLAYDTGDENDIQREIIKTFDHISRNQYQNLLNLVPKAYHTIWETSLKTNLYSLKLNGAGGGGYILGFSLDIDAIEKKLTLTRL